MDTVNVTLACRRAGIARRMAYDWQQADAGVDLLEAELHKRAFEGVERPVYYKGEQVGTWRFYSDALAMFLLKAHRPERYRGTVGSGAVAKALTPEEKAEEVQAYREMFKRIWAHSREEQDRELAAAGHEPRPYPSPPKLEDWK